MGMLDGKVAIITGASKGIGRVMSQQFAREGAKVVCSARSADLVKETVRLVEKAGGSAIAVVGDAAQEGEVKSLVATAVKAFGKIDTLINNAGDGGPTKPVQEYSTEDWFYTLNSCLTSSYMCTRFVVPEMIKAGGGAIVNISSVAGRRGLAFRIGYCSSKAGQIGMTYGLAAELGPHNIRVNAVLPGAIATERQRRLWYTEEYKAEILHNQALKRILTPEEVARLILFLAADDSSAITSQGYIIDGGWV
jgi:D-xylose 1-dehydrogenase